MSVASLQVAVRPADGVFVRRDASRHDLSDYRLRGMERSGVITRIHANTWQFTVVPWTHRVAIRAAVKAAGGLAYASHSSATYLLGLDGPKGRPEITLSGSVAPALDGVRVHRSRSLTSVDVTTIADIPTTAGHRTVVDLAARLSEADRIDLADRAICARVTSRPALHECATRLRSGRRGVSTLVAVTAPGADGVFWSALERLFGRGLRRSGLPMPQFNAPVRHRGELYYVDALWADQLLAVELRGLAFHRRREHRLRDDERLNVFAELDWRCLVFGWRDVHDRFDEVSASIRRALLGSQGRSQVA